MIDPKTLLRCSLRSMMQFHALKLVQEKQVPQHCTLWIVGCCIDL